MSVQGESREGAYDVTVVGGGMGGLSAGALLANRGCSPGSKPPS